MYSFLYLPLETKVTALSNLRCNTNFSIEGFYYLLTDVEAKVYSLSFFIVIVFLFSLKFEQLGLVMLGYAYSSVNDVKF